MADSSQSGQLILTLPRTSRPKWGGVVTVTSLVTSQWPVGPTARPRQWPCRWFNGPPGLAVTSLKDSGLARHRVLMTCHTSSSDDGHRVSELDTNLRFMTLMTVLRQSLEDS
jgi:hypothetical protein